MPNKRNSASCFSLPRCQMTKVLRHPLPKSSREGGPGGGPASPRANRPSSLVSSLLPRRQPPHTHQGPSHKGKWDFLLLPRRSPQQQHDSRFMAGFSWYTSSKQPRCRPELNSYINWRQRPRPGRGFMKNVENNQLTITDGGGRKGKILYF